MKNMLEIVWNYILDTIAPQDPDVRRIELMTPELFLKEIKESDKIEEIKGILHFLPYRNETVKTAIVEIKNYPNKKIAHLLGVILYDFLLSELPDLEMFQNFTSPLLIPIPITKAKKKKRGWNQCELIAREIKKMDEGKTFEIRSDILEKPRENEDQVGKGRAERFKNLENCFSVRKPELVLGRNIIVFDDIVTTGATLLEAKKTLFASGAKKILLVALGH